MNETEQTWVNLGDGEIIQKGDRILAYGTHWEYVEDADSTDEYIIGQPWSAFIHWPVQRLK